MCMEKNLFLLEIHTTNCSYWLSLGDRITKLYFSSLHLSVFCFFLNVCVLTMECVEGMCKNGKVNLVHSPSSSN